MTSIMHPSPLERLRRRREELLERFASGPDAPPRELRDVVELLGDEIEVLERAMRRETAAMAACEALLAGEELGKVIDLARRALGREG